MKEFKGYQCAELEINAGQTKTAEVILYKDFYLSKLKLKIDNIAIENVLIEIEKFLPSTNFKLLLMENDGTFNYVLPIPKFIKQQHLIFNVSNLHTTLNGKVQIFLQGYEDTDRNIELEKFNQAKVKTVNNISIPPGKIDSNLIHQFDEDIMIENIITYFISGKESDVLFNFRNERTGQYLFREPVNLSFLNSFIDNVNGIYTPILYNKRDSVRFFIQNLSSTDSQVFSFSLHGRERRGS